MALTAALAAAMTGCAGPAGTNQDVGTPTRPVLPTTTLPARPTVTPTQAPPPPAAPATPQRLVRIVDVDPLPGYVYRGDGIDNRVGPATLVLDNRSRLELTGDARVIEKCQLLLPPWTTSQNPCWAIAHMADDGQHVVGLRLFGWEPRENGNLGPVLGGESTVRVVDGFAVLRDGTRVKLTAATQYTCPPAIIDGLSAGGTTIPGGSMTFTVDDSLAVTLVECHLPL